MVVLVVVGGHTAGCHGPRPPHPHARHSLLQLSVSQSRPLGAGPAGKEEGSEEEEEQESGRLWMILFIVSLKSRSLLEEEEEERGGGQAAWCSFRGSPVGEEGEEEEEGGRRGDMTVVPNLWPSSGTTRCSRWAVGGFTLKKCLNV